MVGKLVRRLANRSVKKKTPGRFSRRGVLEFHFPELCCWDDDSAPDQNQAGDPYHRGYQCHHGEEVTA